MTLTREAIVEGLTGLLGADKVDTDEQTLKENSLDRYRKLEDIFGIYNLPIPAAIVRVTSTDDVAKTLGGIDILVNNAGMNIRKRPEDLQPDEWQRVLNLSLIHI